MGKSEPACRDMPVTKPRRTQAEWVWRQGAGLCLGWSRRGFWVAGVVSSRCQGAVSHGADIWLNKTLDVALKVFFGWVNMEVGGL